MKRAVSIITIFLICVNTVLASAQDTPKKDKIYVKLTFDANKEDTGLKNQTKSYIKKRLRQLGNIVFTDQKYKFELSFFIFEPKAKTGKGTDIVILSVIVTKPLPDGRPLFVGDTFKACNRQDLRKVCESLVVQINDELIKDDRRMFRSDTAGRG
ncbi:MAG: hypothetical protein WBB86_06745 [Candidatus Omnitrophota bacterium]